VSKAARGLNRYNVTQVQMMMKALHIITVKKCRLLTEVESTAQWKFEGNTMG